MEPKFLIIAGSEKCGTTSLFQYLSDSKCFNVSKKKETDFFRQSEGVDVNNYLDEFQTADLSKPFLEASPGYLSDSEIAANNIANTLKDYHLVFCLREPVARLISSFYFRKSRLYIPEKMSLEEYFLHCVDFDNGRYRGSSLDNWSLRVPDTGKYYKHLKSFELAGIKSYSIVSFEELASDPKSVVDRLLYQMGINSQFYENYEFHHSNITSGYKNKNIQAVALKLNKELERIWIKYPNLKRYLLNSYRRINGTSKPKTLVDVELMASLKNYYAEDLAKLKSEFFDKTPSSWFK